MNRFTGPLSASIRTRKWLVALIAGAMLVGGMTSVPAAASAASMNTISGRVTDSSTGAAIVRATVTASTGGVVVTSTGSDLDGRFALTVSDGATYHVVARAPEFSSKEADIYVTDSDRTFDARLSPGPFFTLTGRVVSNADLWGLMATLYRVDSTSGLATVVSRAGVGGGGVFVLPGGAADLDYRVSIQDSEHEFPTTSWPDSIGGTFRMTADRSDVTITLPSKSFASTSIRISHGNLALGDSISAVVDFSPSTSYDGPQWWRDGIPIAGANSSFYVVTAADQGTTLTFSAYSVRRGYARTTATSEGVVVPAAPAPAAVPAAVLPVVPAQVPAVPTIVVKKAPKLSGTARLGKKLTAHVTKPSGSMVSFQWFANGKPVKKATKSSLVLTKAFIGKQLTVKVTYAKPGALSVVRSTKVSSRVKK